MKESTSKLLAKALRAIEAAERLLEGGDAEFSVGRAYYGLFYVAEALLNERGLGFSKHSAVHAAFASQFVKTGEFDAKYHRWLLDAFRNRIQGDYWFEVDITTEEVKPIIEQAREFLHEARRYLETSP